MSIHSHTHTHTHVTWHTHSVGPAAIAVLPPNCCESVESSLGLGKTDATCHMPEAETEAEAEALPGGIYAERGLAAPEWEGASIKNRKIMKLKCNNEGFMVDRSNTHAV